MRLDRTLAIVAVLSLALAACGGGGGGGGPTGGGGGLPVIVPTASPTPGAAVQTQSDSVAAANAAGAPVEDVSQFESSIDDPLATAALAKRAAETTPTPGASPSPHASSSPSTTPHPSPTPNPTPVPNGVCIPDFFAANPTAAGGSPYVGFEYFSPDRKGDANSVEYAFFYDAACAQPARDFVRVINSVTGTGATKTQVDTSTNTLYALGNPVPTSVSTETNTVTGSFDGHGYPSLSTGFARASQYSLSVNGVVVSQRGSEYIAAPQSGSTLAFCGDSAGFNPNTLASTSQVTGWQNLLASGTRTTNADGSVTWTNSSSGSVYGATPPAALSVKAAALNAACPIATPAFTIAGGTLLSGYSIPSMSTTFKNGILTNLTIVNETMSNGYTLDVATDASLSPTSAAFIKGTISKNGVTIATFAVNARGDGTLTMAATGITYNMVHWHVSTDGPRPSPSPSGSPTAHPSTSPEPTHSPSATPTPGATPTPH